MRIDGRVEHNGRRIRQDRQERLDQEKGPLEIRREAAVKSGLVPLIDRFQFGDSRVEEQDIESSEGFAQSLNGSFLRGHITRVGYYDDDITAEFFACCF